MCLLAFSYGIGISSIIEASNMTAIVLAILAGFSVGHYAPSGKMDQLFSVILYGKDMNTALRSVLLV